MPLFSPHAEILVQWMGILPLGALCGHQARDDYPAMTLMGRGCDRQASGACAGGIGRRMHVASSIGAGSCGVR